MRECGIPRVRDERPKAAHHGGREKGMLITMTQKRLTNKKNTGVAVLTVQPPNERRLRCHRASTVGRACSSTDTTCTNRAARVSYNSLHCGPGTATPTARVVRVADAVSVSY